jgi:predicted RNA binding protein YcfA (HicA-like mRNA interferase family)
MASMYNELIKNLKKANCKLVRSAKGSHEIWYSPISDKNVMVSRSIKSAPLANSILKQAGLPKAF